MQGWVPRPWRTLSSIRELITKSKSLKSTGSSQVTQMEVQQGECCRNQQEGAWGCWGRLFLELDLRSFEVILLAEWVSWVGSKRTASRESQYIDWGRSLIILKKHGYQRGTERSPFLNPGPESLAPNHEGWLWWRFSFTQEINYVLNSKLPQVQTWAAGWDYLQVTQESAWQQGLPHGLR